MGSPTVIPFSARPFDLAERLGQMEQRLRRNAADVEAHAAERRVALDQRHALAEIGGAERGGVAAGAGAEDEDVGVVGVIVASGSSKLLPYNSSRRMSPRMPAR